MLHELKTVPPYFEAVRNGDKQFEVRKNDRGFKIGDEILLREWFPNLEDYSGRTAHRKITYVLQSEKYGVAPGFCVLGLAVI
ncbi:MAG: DUF3850 domain-containing protein [Bacteroidetes bacterium]|nr:DUF3850 domain-containing protein [Bacteroidota bacterium]